MWEDLRIAVRTSRRHPGFTTLAVVTLALGIAANTAIFSVVRGVLLRPLPYPDPGRIVAVWTSTPTTMRSSHSAGDFIDIERENQSFAAIAGYRPDLFAITTDGTQALQFEGAHVTAPFFDVFGMPALAGRAFTQAMDAKAGGRLVVLGEPASRQIFPAGQGAVGAAIRINGQSHVVVGIMPAAFAWPRDAALWVLSDGPVPPAPIAGTAGNREVHYFEAVARLRAGVPDAQVRADLARLASDIDARRPASSERRAIVVQRLHDEIVGEVRPAIVILQIGVGIVLLIACANISSLLIARTTGRAREMAVRAAMGAGAGRLVRQLLAESLVLGVAGGVLGLVLGGWCVALVTRLLPAGMPRTDAIAIDAGVAVVTLAVAIAASVLFGALPALQGSRANAASAIRAGGTRGHTASRSASRSALVVAEVALTIVLLVTAALLGTSLARLSSVDPGFRAAEVTVGSIAIPTSRYPTGVEQSRFYRRLLERLRERGEFASAAIGFPGPLRGRGASGAFFIEGREGLSGDARPFAHVGSISAEYLEAMGIDLLDGRTVRDADTADAPGVVVVSAELARRYWPGERAVGKRIKFDADPAAAWITVIGVTGDVRQLGLSEAPPPLAFFPYEQFPLPFTVITVRGAAPIETVTSALRAAMTATDPELPVADVVTLPALVSGSMADARFRTFVFGALATVALVLAAVGLYGLISYSVAQRTREIGIRVALGAAPRQVALPIIGWGLGLAGMGAALGLAGAWAASRVLTRFLFGVSATDPATFAAAALLLGSVTAVASYLPSRRALRIDPVVALRAD